MTKTLKFRKVLIFLGVFLLASIILVSSPKIKLSATEGLIVAPAFLNVSLTKNEPENFQAVGVKNNFKVPITIEASIKGIDQQTGQLVPTDVIDDSLVQSIEIINPKFSIAPGTSINIQLIVKNTPTLPGGGNFASLFIRQVSESGNKVSFQSAVSVPILITKEEGATRELSITNIKPRHSIFSLPKSVDLTFGNNGNTLLIPRVAISVSGPKQKVRFGAGSANDKSAPVLPGKEITLRAPITITKHPWLPGKYQINVQYRIDGAPNSAVASKSFWYIPISYLLLTPLLFILFIQFIKYKNRTSQANVALNKKSAGHKKLNSSKKIKIQIK